MPPSTTARAVMLGVICATLGGCSWNLEAVPRPDGATSGPLDASHADEDRDKPPDGGAAEGVVDAAPQDATVRDLSGDGPGPDTATVLPDIAVPPDLGNRVNLIVYSNYEGGALDIDVDVPLTNLVIGVVSYAPSTILVSGAYAKNVKEVRFAGFTGAPQTTITVVGAGPNQVNKAIVVRPAATVTDPAGWASIICCHTAKAPTGGCNTAVQVTSYFLSKVGGSLLFHRCQYQTFGALKVSDQGSCS